MNNIINRINKLLNEEYLDSEKIGKIYTEFFVNPSRKELIELGEVRFVIDDLNKNLIVWKACVLHEPAIKYLKSKNLLTKNQESINCGAGRVTLEGKIRGDYVHNKVSGKHWADKFFTKPLENFNVWNWYD